MDFCRNISVSGGLQPEYQPEQVISPSCSKLGSLDDLFSGHVTEGDVDLEWLSIFVEDCLSSTGNCLPPVTLPKNKENDETHTNKSGPIIPNPSQVLNTPKNPCAPPHNFVISGKSRRSKRKRGTLSWSHGFNQINSISDTLLLHQDYWLADSELILSTQDEIQQTKEKNDDEKSGQQPRRCTHCLSQRTPQWRAGPLGPKTLCNACGVRYKSGRLLPEYRPAKSPTFVSYKHSNSHKKVMEMRMYNSS